MAEFSREMREYTVRDGAEFLALFEAIRREVAGTGETVAFRVRLPDGWAEIRVYAADGWVHYTYRDCFGARGGDGQFVEPGDN